MVGAGRTELARALIGKDKITGGQVLIDGKTARISSVRGRNQAASHRLCQRGSKVRGRHTRPSDPLERGDHRYGSKIANRLGLLRASDETKAALPLSQQLEIRTPSLEQLVGNLSGGNQQKVSLAKWLAANVDTLIIDEPTVGIDIKAKAYIHELINQLADKGMSILLISSDMPEMVALADRIVVMHDFMLVFEHENDRRYEVSSRAIMAAIHSGSGELSEPSNGSEI